VPRPDFVSSHPSPQGGPSPRTTREPLGLTSLNTHDSSERFQSVENFAVSPQRRAKRALESGAQITWLSRHLGHSSLKVTTDIYGHWERAERKLQAAKMEDAFPV
jgi:integrase